MYSTKIWDFAVLGGGLSGLQCARRLIKDVGAKSVLLVEGQNRIGGRVLTYRGFKGNGYADLGAQWVNSDHYHVMNLCKELNLGLFNSYFEGKLMIKWSDRIVVEGKETDQDNLILDGYFEFVEQFLKELHSSQSMECLDITLEERVNQFIEGYQPVSCVIDSSTQKRLRNYILTTIETVTSTNPRLITLRYAQFMEQSGGDFSTLREEGESSQMRIQGGAELIIDRIRSQLECHNNQFEILLQSQVTKINNQNTNQPVQIHIAKQNGNTSNSLSINNEVIQAKKVISTIPVYLLKDINLQLSSQQQYQLQESNQYISDVKELMNKYQVGDVIKTFVVFDNPFWRKLSLSGVAFTPESQIISDTYDMSNDHNGILLVFSVGDKAQYSRKLSADEFKSKIISELVELYGSSINQFTEFYSHSFYNEPLIKGGYSGLQIGQVQSKQGVVDAFSKFNGMKNQNVFIIGTETSTKFNGYLEGALRSVDNLFNTNLEQLSLIH